MSSNLDFYRCRHAEEQALAAQTMDLRVRAIHLEMVTLYTKLIELETDELHLRGQAELLDYSRNITLD